MKKLSILLCSLLLLFCCSCRLLDNRKYVCDAEEVKSVQIVRLEDIEPYYQFDYTVLFEITDYITFVDQLNNIETYVKWGTPHVMNVEDIIIRIEYQNGDYELISRGVQCFCRSGTFTDGHFVFDESEFEALIEKYLNN